MAAARMVEDCHQLSCIGLTDWRCAIRRVLVSRTIGETATSSVQGARDSPAPRASVPRRCPESVGTSRRRKSAKMARRRAIGGLAGNTGRRVRLLEIGRSFEVAPQNDVLHTSQRPPSGCFAAFRMILYVYPSGDRVQMVSHPQFVWRGTATRTDCLCTRKPGTCRMGAAPH